MREYLVLTNEDPANIQLDINDASKDGFIMDKFSYATGAGLFYALMLKEEK